MRLSVHYVNPSPRKATCTPASHKVLRILLDPKVHRRFQNSPPPLIHIRRLINPVHVPHPISLRLILILTPFTSRPSKSSHSFKFPYQNAISTSRLSHACHMPALVIILNRRAVARYRALASTMPGREKFSWNLSF